MYTDNGHMSHFDRGVYCHCEGSAARTRHCEEPAGDAAIHSPLTRHCESRIDEAIYPSKDTEITVKIKLPMPLTDQIDNNSFMN